MKSTTSQTLFVSDGWGSWSLFTVIKSVHRSCSLLRSSKLFASFPASTSSVDWTTRAFLTWSGQRLHQVLSMSISAKPTFYLFPSTFCIWHCSAWLQRLRFRDKEKFVAIYRAQEVSGLFVNTHLQKSILGQDLSADILSMSPDGSVK